MCCAIKPLAGWNIEEVASVTRERCGGQGYLSCNRFGTFLGSAHAALTAEGDNSVLMQKVAKERLTKFRPHKVGTIQNQDVLDAGYLHSLLQNRENLLFMTIGKKLMKAGKDGLFDTWMYQESDLVQAAARAYGEQLVSEQFGLAINKADESLKYILKQLRTLYLLTVLEQNLGWFVTSGLVSPELGAKINPAAAELCHQMAPQALHLCDAFAITDTMLSAPIALDWVDYNVRNNQGEL